ncbi:MAG: 50S ribosomal protein L1 [Chlamydiia bacterium]
MTKFSKRMKEIKKSLVDRPLSIQEALNSIKKEPKVKFDASVDINISLNIDTKKADQQVRTSVVLPHGTGKQVRVVVVTKDLEKAAEAKANGAIEAGSIELLDRMQAGWVDYDVVIASPDVMRDFAKVAKVLGPRGLMPNPKSGTVTQDVVTATIEACKGKVELKPDKMGQVHLRIGRLSFENDKLAENAEAILAELIKAKPRALKGAFIKSVYMASTMGGSHQLAVTAE